MITPNKVELTALNNCLILDREAVRNPDGSYRYDCQQGWEEYFVGIGKRLPTVQEYIKALKQLDERNDPALEGILQDLTESYLCTGLRIDYTKSNIPLGSNYVDNLINNPAWQKALEDELFHYDAREVVDVLQRASGKRPYISTPSAYERKSYPERAVWLDILADRFGLYCGYGPINSGGRARGVRAAGACAEKMSSPYRNSERTEEEIRIINC